MVGSDPGISAELNGGTHMSFEDIGVMRSLPSLTIVEPVDAAQLKAALPQILSCKEAVYLRLFRKQARKIYDEGCAFTLGKANTLREGSDVTIIAGGIMVGESLDAADLLANEGIKARVLDMHTVKPLDREAVVRAAKETGAIVTCDNHNIIGALGTAVAEVTAEECPVPVIRIGVTDHFGEVGKMDFLKSEIPHDRGGYRGGRPYGHSEERRELKNRLGAYFSKGNSAFSSINRRRNLAVPNRLNSRITVKGGVYA